MKPNRRFYKNKQALKIVSYSWQFQMTIWADEYKTIINSQKNIKSLQVISDNVTRKILSQCA